MDNKETFTFDELTGLFTRKSLHQYLSRYDNDDQILDLTIIAVELSRFGVVNNSVGTTVGDKIIAMLAKRLIQTFPQAIATGRLHGDHFALVFSQRGRVEEELETLFDFAQRPMAIHGEVIVLSVRVGIALGSSNFSTAIDLIHGAELALHTSKSKLSKISYFAPSMVDSSRSIHRLENDLRLSLVTNATELHSAICNAEFELMYQPIVSSCQANVHAFEALIRWHHPKRGTISPSEFIPIAEKISVMSVLGDWIIRKACKDAVTWLANSDGSLPSVSINVSPAQFQEADILMASLASAIEESGIQPQRVKLEITESARISSQMQGHLQAIKRMGCKLSMDDFGTGYSTIAQLSSLPLDYIKIDRSIMRDLDHRNTAICERATRLIKAVFSLVQSLELISIVEGIESPESLNAVTGLGADLIQGFVYSEALAEPKVNEFIQHFRGIDDGKI